MAAGFSFSEEKASFETVKKALNQTVDEILNGEKLTPSLDIDLELDIDDIDILGFDQVRFVVEGVKVSFYAAPRKRIPTMQEIPYLNNLRIADVNSIGIMKMEAMMRRSKFRDYYDIYSILKNGADIMTMIPAALEHSGYKLKTKNLMAMLTNGELFQKDENFEQLSPIYDVSSHDIQEYLKALIGSR